MQEYFFVSCSLADISAASAKPTRLAGVAGQGGDPAQRHASDPRCGRTHAVLLDDAGLSWDEAWAITWRTLAYTNHTLLAEALERWPVEWVRMIAPRLVEIIFEINRRLLDDIRCRFPVTKETGLEHKPDRGGPERRVRTANLGIVGWHSTNGVAEIDSKLSRARDRERPCRGVPGPLQQQDQRRDAQRWIKLANPSLAETITAAIGDGSVTDLAALRKLKPLAEDADFRNANR